MTRLATVHTLIALIKHLFTAKSIPSPYEANASLGIDLKYLFDKHYTPFFNQIVLLYYLHLDFVYRLVVLNTSSEPKNIFDRHDL
jgi:hypothetical protein